MGWVLAPEGQLLRVPLFELQLEADEPPVRKVSQVFQPFLTGSEVRWVLSHMRKASELGVDATIFPCSFNDAHLTVFANQMPALPRVVTPTISLAPVRMPCVTSLSVADAWAGVHFSRLTKAQQAFIVNFIEVNGDWPLLPAMPREMKIQLCLLLIDGATTITDSSLTYKNYRCPNFLATLMTGSFYPAEENAPGWHTTVGDVWCFANVLLRNAAKNLGYRREIVFHRPPRGTGVRSDIYLARHPSYDAIHSTIGLTTQEELVCELVSDHIEEAASINFSAYNNAQLEASSQILRGIIGRMASVNHLSDILLYSMVNLLGLDEEAACDFMIVTSQEILARFDEERVFRLSGDENQQYQVANSQTARGLASQTGLFSNRTASNASVDALSTARAVHRNYS